MRSANSLQQSWATTLRYLAASRFYLPAALPTSDSEAAWSEVEHFLRHNELELALESAIELGDLVSAPPQYWGELLLAAREMGLDAVVPDLSRRVDV
jgi:hypothetical protein